MTKYRPLAIVALAIAGGIALRTALEPLIDHTQLWVDGAVFMVCALVVLYATHVLRKSRAAEKRERDDAEAARARLRVLVDLATVLASADTLDAIAHAVVSEGKRTANADTTGLYIVDDDSARLRLVGTIGGDPGLVDRLRDVPLGSMHGERLCREHWVENQAQFEAAMPDLADVEVSTRKAEAFWSIPLIVEGQTRGVLTMGFYRPRPFPPEEREFARLFAQHCAQAVARAERSDRLDRERDRLDRLFDANLIGTVFWEAPGRIVRANESFLRALGYTQDDLAAGRVDWGALTPSEYATADEAALESVVGTGSHEAYEKEYVHKDGHRVPVLVSSAAFFDDRKKGVTFAADLTEVKRAADVANRAKDEFLAMLGHELRNPLAPITTALELIEMRGVEVSERALAIVRRQVLHLTRMVDDLLDIARIRSGKIQLRRRRTELADIVRGAFETATPLIQSRGQKLTVDVPQAGLVVDVDPTRIGQVLSNILTNAAKYTDAAGTIRVAATRDGDAVVVTVADSGIGIAPELLPKVFELFTQEPQNVDRSRGGLGLGLALSRTFVELHGGTITAHSAGRNQGTMITVRLLLAEATERPALTTAPMPAIAAALGPLRVLVVDDNADAADMLAGVAEHRGHVTLRANDGPSALRMLEEFRPDVALLDLGLPAMDGFELAERIRRMPNLGRIRLVAVTGYGLPTDRDKTRAAGFDLHLVKPLEVHDVIRAIEAPHEPTPSVVDPS